MAAAAAEMLIPLKRVGTPDEAAGAMLMLASPYASFISGQVRIYMHLTPLIKAGALCSVYLCCTQVAFCCLPLQKVFKICTFLHA